MSNDASLTELQARASRVLDQLAGLAASAVIDAARRLVAELRDGREYELVARVAEAVSRIDPTDAKNRRLYAQALIETGNATAAIDMLQALTRRLPAADPEQAEATGLLGRAYKQIFFEARDKTTPGARHALQEAIAAYRKPYEENPGNTWHGVNLLALLANSRRLGIPVTAGLDPVNLAQQVVTTLEARPAGQRDQWFLPTLAEAYLGLDDWDAVERNVRAYAAAPDAQAFLIASTLRQFTRIWNLEELERGRGLVNILRARLMQLSGGELRVAPADVQRLREEQPSAGQLEAVLGAHGAQTFRWWQTGMARALSVVSIRRRLGNRIGSGFLVRAADLGVGGEELVILTNFHVVNASGASPGIKPQEAEIVFEGIDAAPTYTVDKLLWSSPPEQCDASVLRLTKPVTGIEPLPIASALPQLDGSAQVYLIGYPGGRELAISFQDNELLDHEGPPHAPQIPGVCRVHYRAPTEGGSSGSPVFDATAWEVIALHHKGGKLGMPRLNGAAGTYAANEGIAIASIARQSKTGPT